jgi:hypothetical protein
VVSIDEDRINMFVLKRSGKTRELPTYPLIT